MDLLGRILFASGVSPLRPTIVHRRAVEPLPTARVRRGRLRCPITPVVKASDWPDLRVMPARSVTLDAAEPAVTGICRQTLGDPSVDRRQTELIVAPDVRRHQFCDPIAPMVKASGWPDQRLATARHAILDAAESVVQGHCFEAVGEPSVNTWPTEAIVAPNVRRDQSSTLR